MGQVVQKLSDQISVNGLDQILKKNPIFTKNFWTHFRDMIQIGLCDLILFHNAIFSFKEPILEDLIQSVIRNPIR